MLFAEGSEEWADRLKLLLQLNVVVLAQVKPPPSTSIAVLCQRRRVVLAQEPRLTLLPTPLPAPLPPPLPAPQELWCNEHYFWMMVPWVHYVPVGTRFEELRSALAWLRANDGAAQRIAANAQARFRPPLTYRRLLSSTSRRLQPPFLTIDLRPFAGLRGGAPLARGVACIPPHAPYSVRRAAGRAGRAAPHARVPGQRRTRAGGDARDAGRPGVVARGPRETA